MKSSITKVVFLISCFWVSISLADAAEIKPYAEVQLGYANFDNIIDKADHTDNSSIDSAANFGLELGLKDFLVPNLRLALSDNYSHTKINSSPKQGTGINYLMANAYYDFKLNNSLVPYLGVGMGTSHLSGSNGNQFTWSLSAGANYYVNSNVYLGAKVSYVHIGDIKGHTGDEYESPDNYLTNLVLGYSF